jgi:hypothetical protein
MLTAAARPKIHSEMAERRLHLIAEDIAEDAVEEWATSALTELESYLAKHAAFESYLEEQEAA